MIGKVWSLIPGWGKGAAIAAALAFVAGSYWWTYDAGRDAERDEWKTKIVEAKAKAIDDYEKARQADRALVSRWWEADRDREPRVKVITREVVRYVEQNPDVADRRCFDERMRELWNGVQRRSLRSDDDAAGGASEGVPGRGAGPEDESPSNPAPEAGEP